MKTECFVAAGLLNENEGVLEVFIKSILTERRPHGFYMPCIRQRVVFSYI